MADQRPRLIVCADDYAFTPGVSHSIRALLEARRISATSVMAASPCWPDEAAALQAVAGDADIGLHITLTDQTPLGPMPGFAANGRLPPMGAVYRRGLGRQLPAAVIRDEIERQLERFMTHWGRPPAHIDGHHHVQQLPVVRDIVVALATRLSPRPWVRVSGDRIATVWQRGVGVPKALVIGALGRGIARRAGAAGVPTNAGFGGAYDFNQISGALGPLFQRFLHGARENTLIMCHPGHADAELAALDIMVDARDREHAFLMSADWPAMLAAAGVSLGPYRHGPVAAAAATTR